MELKRAKLTGTTSESGNSLQHEAAMRAEARWQADEKRRRHARLMGRLRTLFFLLVVAGGVFYAWRAGMLDSIRTTLGFGGRDVRHESENEAVAETPAAPAAAPRDTPVVKRIEENIDAFNATMASFAGATIAYWKDAVPEDKPVAKGPPLTYTALVPDAKGECAFLEVSLAGDNSMKIKRITQTRGLVDMSRADFNKMVETTPYLVMREGRAYYCSAGKPARQKGFPVPKKGESFNPSRQEFGTLYELIGKAKLAKPDFKYDVFLDHVQFKKKLPVATVGFGEEVSHDRFEAAARAAVDDDAVVAVLLEAAKVGFATAK